MTSYTPSEMEDRVLKILHEHRLENVTLLSLCAVYHAKFTYGNAYYEVPKAVKKMVKKGQLIVEASGESWWQKYRVWRLMAFYGVARHKRVWDGERIVRIAPREAAEGV